MYQVQEITDEVMNRNTGKFAPARVLGLVDENGQRDYVGQQFELDEMAKAQEACDYLNGVTKSEEAIDVSLFSDWIDQNTAFETGTQTPEPQAEPAEEIGLDGQYTVGQEVEANGVIYIVEKTFHIDAETSDFLDDMGDMTIAPGWHANARRKL